VTATAEEGKEEMAGTTYLIRLETAKGSASLTSESQQKETVCHKDSMEEDFVKHFSYYPAH
jgi:hypothetical protein